MKVIIEDELKTDQGATEVLQKVDGKKILDPDNTVSELSTVFNTINNQFEHECLNEVVRLLNVHPFCHSTDNCVPGHK